MLVITAANPAISPGTLIVLRCALRCVSQSSCQDSCIWSLDILLKYYGEVDYVKPILSNLLVLGSVPSPVKVAEAAAEVVDSEVLAARSSATIAKKKAICLGSAHKVKRVLAADGLSGAIVLMTYICR